MGHRRRKFSTPDEAGRVMKRLVGGKITGGFIDANGVPSITVSKGGRLIDVFAISNGVSDRGGYLQLFDGPEDLGGFGRMR